jgi:LPS export ABC transporter protein LptC
VKADRTLVIYVFMTFFDDLGEIAGTLSAKSGEINTESKEVAVQGEVVVESVRGYTFYSDRLDYADATRTISTDDPVRMVSEKHELTGTGLRFNVDKHAYQILSKVRARIQGDGNP